MTDINIVLFSGFETLDVFGPVEVIGKLPQFYSPKFYSVSGGIVISSQQVPVDTLPFSDLDRSGILLIPGGIGTRMLADDIEFISYLRSIAETAPYILTVCTGTALVAKTELLNGLSATTNKKAFNWVASTNSNVNWVKSARWVKDGRFYTSSGVSAGLDMILGFVSDIHGRDTARQIAKDIEYVWNDDPYDDPFAVC